MSEQNPVAELMRALSDGESQFHAMRAQIDADREMLEARIMLLKAVAADATDKAFFWKVVAITSMAAFSAFVILGYVL